MVVVPQRTSDGWTQSSEASQPMTLAYLRPSTREWWLGERSMYTRYFLIHEYLNVPDAQTPQHDPRHDTHLWGVGGGGGGGGGGEQPTTMAVLLMTVLLQQLVLVVKVVVAAVLLVAVG